jgi:hypothetical protein
MRANIILRFRALNIQPGPPPRHSQISFLFLPCRAGTTTDIPPSRTDGLLPLQQGFVLSLPEERTTASKLDLMHLQV